MTKHSEFPETSEISNENHMVERMDELAAVHKSNTPRRYSALATQSQHRPQSISASAIKPKQAMSAKDRRTTAAVKAHRERAWWLHQQS